MNNLIKTFYTISLIIMISSCMQPVTKLGLSYGAFLRPGGIEFKIYAPNSDKVKLVIFEKVDDESGYEYPMEKLENGDWRYFLKNAPLGTMYGYRLTGPWNDENVIVADPYSKATVTQNNWRHVAKSLVIDASFDWEGDTWTNIHPRDLIIYESHVRDMTVHNSSNATAKGSYLGFIEKDQNGGIEHLKSLGVNAVQFLPLWDFANFEIPYKQDADGMYNDWNPYERNHWGYMPTFFMAPESYYATDGTNEPNAWNGKDGRAVTEMKDMVKSLHQEGMAVILDVVVNHISNYDWHPLKYIDKTVYFKLDEQGDFLSQCCGNLLASDHQPVRDYIIE
ncbi:MAG TPA: pullulanase, partial [Candidatus Marinimicrobia bacterium]|nr:pullulanase [Candidatus Neomarinimicrobiota bacterium]